MKLFLLFGFLLFYCHHGIAQQAALSELPLGRYQTSLKSGAGKWNRGDIILLDDSHYRVSSTDTVGEYRFSKAAQRILFTSGPLRAAFAKVKKQGQQPMIELPLAENYHQPLAASDVVAVLKQ